MILDLINIDHYPSNYYQDNSNLLKLFINSKSILFINLKVCQIRLLLPQNSRKIVSKDIIEWF